jgi:hypothetical protein
VEANEIWKLIDTTRKAAGGDVSKQADLLVEILVKRTIDEIFAFDAIWDDLMDNAYDAALWDAADIIGCSCSDDGFWDFRGWLIAQGREVYENALADPESLVDMIDVDDDGKHGALIYATMTAYEQKTGQTMPPNKYPTDYHYPHLKGMHWPEENRKERFPKLAAKFGDCEQRWKIWLYE